MVPASEYYKQNENSHFQNHQYSDLSAAGKLLGNTVETYNYESKLNSVQKIKQGSRTGRKFKVKLDGNVVEIKEGNEIPVERTVLNTKTSNLVNSMQTK